MVPEFPASCAFEHLTPTKRRIVVNGEQTSHRQEERCLESEGKTIFNFSKCVTAHKKRNAYGHSASGRACYRAHLRRCHDRAVSL